MIFSQKTKPLGYRCNIQLLFGRSGIQIRVINTAKVVAAVNTGHQFVTPTMNTTQVAMAVTGLDVLFEHGLLIAHSPSGGFYFFYPRQHPRFLSINDVNHLWPHMTPMPHAMRYTEPCGCGHYEPCVRSMGPCQRTVAHSFNVGGSEERFIFS